jgi:tetratricopeptide (TPR) repeat protein
MDEIMDVESYTSEETAEEDRRARRRLLIQNAITLATQSRWQEALEANREIVEIAPEDAEAFNRLGKAHTELGQITEAREAYENSLKADPANLIAQRNLDRLSRITETEAADLAAKAGQKLDPRFFMEETGKTGVTLLEAVADEEVLATLGAGDEIQVREQDGGLVAVTTSGTYIGRVEKSLEVRLLRLIQTGNQYQAGIVGVDGSTVRIIIREIQQSAENAGRISFPPRTTAESLPRPYVREGLLRRAAGDEVEEDEDTDRDPSETESEDDDDEASEFGFHESRLDET